MSFIRGVFTCWLLFFFSSVHAENLIQDSQSSYIKETAQRFVAALNERDLDKLKAEINEELMVANFIETADISGPFSRRKQIEKDMRSSLENETFANWFNMLDTSNGVAKYRRIITIDGQMRGLVLLDFGDQGLNFLEAIVDPKSEKIYDFYVSAE